MNLNLEQDYIEELEREVARLKRELAMSGRNNAAMFAEMDELRVDKEKTD